MKKSLFITLLFSSALLIADDLIVDKNAMSQYQKDNYYLQFDLFGFNNSFKNEAYGGKSGIPYTPDYIDLSDKAVVLGNSFTQEVWIKPLHKGNNTQVIIGWSPQDSSRLFTPSDSDNRSPSIWIQKTGITYGFGTGSKFIFASFTDSVTESPEWFHVAVTFDGTNYKLFINGNEVNNNTYAAGYTPVNTPVNFIGKDFNGKMDEVRMWNVARTESEIKADMDKRLTGTESNLVAYYPMDININYELADLSPNQNHGTINHVDVRQKFLSNDCNAPDGTESCPYPTINSALDDAKPGDRVLIKEGRYSEYIKKWEYHDVKIEGYPGDNVMIDGTIPLNAKWEPYNHNGHSIYKTVIDFDSLSYNNLFPVDSIYSVFVNDRYMIMSMPVNFKNPTDPTTGNPQNPEPGTLFSLKIKSPLIYDEGYQPGTLADLDTLEEWSFDPSTSTLYLYPSPGYIPTPTNVRVRIGTVMLAFQDCDNLQFKNLHFYSGSLTGYACDHFIIEDSKFSFSVDMRAGARPGAPYHEKVHNALIYGEYSVLRNVIFEHMNNAPPWYQQRTMYPTFENVLFRNHNWFYGSGRYPVSDRNYRGTTGGEGGGNIVYGGSVWRYVTVENSISAGIFPGYRSLVEYSRFENLYTRIDGSAIQRNGANSEYSTTRYTWIINAPKLNGMRWNSSCGGIQADAHHVVSAGNARGFRLKGDYHEAYHLLAYDNGSQDLSLPSYKYCGPDRAGSPEPGNANSKLHNSMAENSLECNAPDCTSSADNPMDGNASLDPVFLDSSGIWFGRAYDEDHKHPFSNVMFDLADAWSRNRGKSDQKLIEEFGENPWKNNQIQNYDFRPKKGSTLIDGGIVIPGINDGQDMDYNHPPLYPGQNRKYIGAAPDIGPYEYGDSVYWIPGYRYPHPSVPIPSNGTVDLPMEYGLAWNYPYKKDYSDVSAEVTISGPGINKTETFQYPKNVLFETFE
ncbi:MAG: LamG domain-containing protein, partial [Candidatus Marinimicrobia bacterium]|nr:LamG domain-containing protein [Candidatus Neomarinimicrobiota bacterium]